MNKRILCGILLIFVVIIIICCLTFSRNNSINEVKVLNSNIINATNMPFKVRRLFSYVIKGDEINSLYGNPKLTRKVSDYFYEIRYIDDESKLYVIYYSDTGAVYDIWRVKKLFNRDDFKSIKLNNSTFDDVNKIDPYSLYFGDAEGEGISEHRLINDEVLIIHYTKYNNIATVKDLEFITPDPSNFADILTKGDLKQVLP